MTWCNMVLHHHLFILPPLAMAGMAVVELKSEPESKLYPQAQHAQQAQERSNIGNEIECPRCWDMMILCSDFDALYYRCEECDFVLYAVEKVPPVSK